MKYIFHYHLIQPRKNGDQTHYHGIIHRSAPIDGLEAYASAVQYICDQLRVPKKQVIVSNMSLLSATPD
jgi:hypothetical protein